MVILRTADSAHRTHAALKRKTQNMGTFKISRGARDA